MSDLKTLPVLDASQLQEGEHKAVDFDGGRVLLSKIKGQVYATQANCSHYGAPLEKGVMSADGRAVCPWHGGGWACGCTTHSSVLQCDHW